MHARFSLCSMLVVAGLWQASFFMSAARAQSSPTLQYHIAGIVPKLPGESPSNNQPYAGQSPVAVNSQGYVLFAFRAADAASTDKTRPVVYFSDGRIVVLPLTGLNFAPGSQSDSSDLIVLNLSDVAADGSFRVVGRYPDADGHTRPVVWAVDTAGNPSNPQPLQNIVLPPDSAYPGEQGMGTAYAINSSGLVVGDGNSYLLGEPLTWQLPGTAATVAPEPADAYTGGLKGVDESGNYVGISSDGDATPRPTFNAQDLPLPIPPDLTHPHGFATCVNNGYAGGYYYPDTYYNTTTNNARIAFLYKDGVATSLPYHTISTYKRSDAVVQQVNGQGDALGQDVGISTGYALWKRQSDGSYLEYAFADLAITQATSGLPTLDFSVSHPVAFTADGSLVVTAVKQAYDPAHPYTLPYNGLTVFLKPGADTTHPAFFSGEAALGNGVYYLSFSNGNYFGYYSYLDDPKYIFHFDMGYEYLFDANDGSSGIYLYDFKSSTFFYSSPSFPFPYLYDFSLNTFLYYYPDPNNAGHYNTNGARYFYRFDTKQIFLK